MTENAASSSSIDDAFLLALGKFVHKFAIAERRLRELLGFYLEMSGDLRVAVIGNVRMNEALKKIKKTLEIKGKNEELMRLEPTLIQLSEINKLRNYILHDGFLISMNNIISRRRSFRPNDDVTVPISIETLNQMTEDLKKAVFAIFYELAPPEERSTMASDFPELSTGPWRYKPVQPTKGLS